MVLDIETAIAPRMASVPFALSPLYAVLTTTVRPCSRMEPLHLSSRSCTGRARLTRQDKTRERRRFSRVIHARSSPQLRSGWCLRTGLPFGRSGIAPR
jgi:hypothetical protein